jgi:hypothetical protein
MEENLRMLIKYRIERSRETFEEALLMKREEHWNACIMLVSILLPLCLQKMNLNRISIAE